ncbi:MAG: protein kinase [Deltaproteobacteria bacterium]|nr:protein kinase [Deltaproteobacteria bacterium]
MSKLDFKPFRIGKYTMLERIATGGMAEVYRAKSEGAGGFVKQLAIKRILPTYSTNDEFRRMFEYEARLSSQLGHANIVQIYDFIKSGDSYLLAMEFVDGKNLRQFVNKAKKSSFVAPVEFGAFIINEVCKGLEYAHSKKDDLTGQSLNIIHRDMSPQNIMLSYEGAVKIVDFGIAKAKDRVDETRSGVIKGKFGYMSPEQANGMDVDHRTDIFSTAIILYELLTGKRLFAAENDMATLRRIQECVVARPTLSNPRIPPELEKIVLKGLAKDLKFRFQSAGAFHLALQELLNKLYPSFTQKDVGDVMLKMFAEEIPFEKKRFEHIYNQSIPFSQGVAVAESSDPGVEFADGSVTQSEIASNQPVTSATPARSLGGKNSESATASGEPKVKVSNSLLADSSDQSETGSERTLVDIPTGASEPVEDSSNRVEGSSNRVEGSSDPVEASSSGMQEQEERTFLDGPLSPASTEQDPESTAMPLIDDKIQSSLPTLGGEKHSGRVSTSIPTASAAGSTRPKSSPPAPPRPKFKVNTVPKAEPEPKSEPKSEPHTGPELELSDEPILPKSKEAGKKASWSQTPEPSDKTSRSGMAWLDTPQEGPKRGSKIEIEETTDQGRTPLFDEPSSGFGIKTVFSVVLFLAVAGGTLYLYRFYMEGGLPALISSFTQPESQPKPPRRGANIDEPKKDLPTTAAAPAKETCAAEITTEPAGAQVFLNGTSKGTSPVILAMNCGEGTNITVEKFGYEAVNKNFVITEKMMTSKQNRIHERLVPIPMGTLELTVSQNATVFVNDKHFTEAKANHPFSVTVRANRKTHVVFRNTVLNLYAAKTYIVGENKSIRDEVRLEVATMPKSPKKK